MKGVEVVGGMPDLRGLVSQPLDVLDDRADESLLLGLRVGVVEAEHAGAIEVFGGAEVDDDGFGVADVQEAVGFGWEPGLDPAAIGACRVVAVDCLGDEVVGDARFAHGGEGITFQATG